MIQNHIVTLTVKFGMIGNTLEKENLVIQNHTFAF